MKSRRIDDLSQDQLVLVYNVKSSSWEHIPRNIGVYTLGFPCTPWSMTLIQSWKSKVCYKCAIVLNIPLNGGFSNSRGSKLFV